MNRLYLKSLVKDLIIERVEEKMTASSALQTAITKIDRQETDPITAATEVVKEIF